MENTAKGPNRKIPVMLLIKMASSWNKTAFQNVQTIKMIKRESFLFRLLLLASSSSSLPLNLCVWSEPWRLSKPSHTSELLLKMQNLKNKDHIWCEIFIQRIPGLMIEGEGLAPQWQSTHNEGHVFTRRLIKPSKTVWDHRQLLFSANQQFWMSPSSSSSHSASRHRWSSLMRHTFSYQPKYFT